MNINTLNESTFLSNLRFYFLCKDNAKPISYDENRGIFSYIFTIT